MKMDFPMPSDGGTHEYCALCHAETVERFAGPGTLTFRCTTCGRHSGRAIRFSDGFQAWVAEDGELWHESAAVFVYDPAARLLLFERTIFPPGLTVPAGHVERGEDVRAAAARELAEEVGLRPPALRHAFTADFTDDPCSAGADTHRWHVFACVMPAVEVEVRDEGRYPVWLSSDDALRRRLIRPVEEIIRTRGILVPFPG
jgi:ADP-ribose pyrophosphatase YjhB (NUDIX family)